MISIASQVSIPLSELTFTMSRSSGPGGQNVNKVNSRVSLHFSVMTSPYLRDDQKTRILHRLKSRINKEGVLQLHAQNARSQVANRETLIERFAKILGEALMVPKIRKKRTLPRGVAEQRLDQKKHRGNLKKKRTAPRNFDD